MITNGHSLTFVINTAFPIFNSIGILKNSSNQVFIRFQNSFTTIEVLKAKLKSRENMERSNSIFNDKLKDHEDRWLKLL
jgi:predicted ABC-type exoprotein transport system permease subunit